MSTKEQALKTLNHLTSEASLLNHTLALLSWDQETYMPEGAIDERSQQQALLSALVHQRLTSDELGQALETLEGSDLSDGEARMVRHVTRTFRKARTIPEAFIREMAVTTSQAHPAWVKARETNDFKAFQPHLEKIVDLKHQEAAYVGFETEAYDALLDEYEPGARAEQISRVFDDLAKELVPLVQDITARPRPDTSFLHQKYPQGDQEAFGKKILSAMGYNFAHGRLDQTAHPFCTTLGRHDVRTTTHYHEEDFTKSLYSIIHEGGHALYEMQFAPDLPEILATGTSLGIHESQSRTWENMVARSRPFWKHWFPELQKTFPTQLAGKTADDVWRAVNAVEKSLIRIYADELTYSLHIMLRFNLELGIMRRDIAIKDIPQAWNDESKRLLDLVPPSDKDGCLQDIHWSMGGLGYFPTYALGNLYGAMFMERAQKDLPGLWTSIGTGDMAPLRGWLGERIHRHGSAKTPGELVQDICGKPLDHRAFMDYLKRKYAELYSA